MPCPVLCDIVLSEPLEVVIMLSSNYTVGSSHARRDEALAHAREQLGQHGHPITFLSTPEWRVHDIRSWPVAVPVSVVAEKLARLEDLGEPLERLPDYSREHYEFQYGLRTDHEDDEWHIVRFRAEGEVPWHVAWGIIGALVSRADDEGCLTDRNQLLEAAKIGLGEVLDVRLRQLEVAKAEA